MNKLVMKMILGANALHVHIRRTKKSGKGQRGFIALMSAIIISAVLLAAASAVGASAFYARFDVLNAEYKRVSIGLAESCARVVLLRIAQNYSYTPTPADTQIAVGVDSQGAPETCTIDSLGYEEDAAHHQKEAVLWVRGSYRGTFSTFRIAAIVHDPSFAQSGLEQRIAITSWQEVAQ